MAANTNKFIIDASVITATLLPDEKLISKSDEILEIINQPKNKLISCRLLSFEVSNSIKSAVIRKRINKKNASRLIKQYQQLNINFQPINLSKTLQIAFEYSLSFYDASYVFLSKSLKAPLLTLDKKLSRLIK